MQSLVSGTAAQLVKWVQPPQYHPLSHLALPLLLLLLLRLVNRLWDRVQLQLHHKSFSSSLQVASRCTCHMLPNVGNFPLFLSFQIKTQIPNRATRSEVQRLRCASPSHTLSLSLSLARSFLIYGSASNIIMLYPKYSRALENCGHVFLKLATDSNIFEKLSLFIH